MSIKRLNSDSQVTNWGDLWKWNLESFWQTYKSKYILDISGTSFILKTYYHINVFKKYFLLSTRCIWYQNDRSLFACLREIDCCHWRHKLNSRPFLICGLYIPQWYLEIIFLCMVWTNNYMEFVWRTTKSIDLTTVSSRM